MNKFELRSARANSKKFILPEASAIYDIEYVCQHLKSLIIKDLPPDFVVAASFRYGFSDEEIRKAICAYRIFLHALFDRLIAGKSEIDAETGRKFDPAFGLLGDKYRAKACFPTLWDLTMTICTLGICGKIEKSEEIKLTVNQQDLTIVICPTTEKEVSFIKMNEARRREMFTLLSDAGLCFHKADASSFYITSDVNELLPLGLKLIAEATAHHKAHYKLENMFYPITLRGSCYSLIANTPKAHVVRIEDFVNSQSQEVKKWLLELHAILLHNGCTSSHNLGCHEYEFTYLKHKVKNRKGMVCQIDIGITGSYIMPGINHLAKEKNIIAELPDSIIALLTKKAERECGWCVHSRKSPNVIECVSNCSYRFTHNGKEYVKCRYAEFYIPLDTKENRDVAWKWIEMELLCN